MLCTGPSNTFLSGLVIIRLRHDIILIHIYTMRFLFIATLILAFKFVVHAWKTFPSHIIIIRNVSIGTGTEFFFDAATSIRNWTIISLVIDARNTGSAGAAEERFTTIFQATQWFSFAATIIKTGVSVTVDTRHTDITGQTSPSLRRTIKMYAIHLVHETNACIVIAALIVRIGINSAAAVSTGSARCVNTHSVAGALVILVAIDDATHLHFVICAKVFCYTLAIRGAVMLVSAFVAVVLVLSLSFKRSFGAYTCIASRFTVVFVMKVLALGILATAQRN